MESKIDIDVGGWPTCSGASVDLYLVPAAEREEGRPRVYTFGHVGPGTPEGAWNHRELYLGDVPVDCDPESLRDWLKSQEEVLLGLASEYRGAVVNVHGNRIGKWGEMDDEAFLRELHEAVDKHYIDRYWDAEDYLHEYVKADDVREAVKRLGSVEAAVQDELSRAGDVGVLLRESEVQAYYERRLQADE